MVSKITTEPTLWVPLPEEPAKSSPLVMVNDSFWSTQVVDPPPLPKPLRAPLFGKSPLTTTEDSKTQTLRFEWRPLYDQWLKTLKPESNNQDTSTVVRLFYQDILINPQTTLLIIQSSWDSLDDSRKTGSFFQTLANTKITEVRIRFARGNTNTYWLSEGKWNADHESSQTLTVLEDPHDFESRTKRHTSIQLAEIHTTWTPPARLPKLPDLLKTAQKDNGLTIENIRYRISQYLGEDLKWEQVKKDFNGGYKYIPLKRLRAYAQLFGLDIRLLIASANARFDQYKPTDWSADHYPLYIDSEEDHLKMAYFKRFDPKHQSLGWQIYASRKNPFNYHAIGLCTWLTHHGIHINNPLTLEYNTAAPTPKTIQALAAILNKPLATVAQWTCETYFGNGPFALDEINGIRRDDVLAEFGVSSLHELFKRLFPGQIIYPDVSTTSLDFKKILLYARQPANPGYLLFAARQAINPLDTMSKFAADSSFYEQTLHDREMGKTSLTKDNLHFWIKIFQAADIPLALLGAFIDDPRLDENSSAHIVSSHLDTTLKTVREETTASKHVLDSIRTDSDTANVRYGSLWQLSTELGIPIHDLTIRQHPELLTIFPELQQDSGSIIVPQFVRKMSLTHFNMSEFLIDILFRNKLTVKDLGDRLGVDDNMLRHYIFANSQCQSADLLIDLADHYLAPVLKPHLGLEQPGSAPSYLNVNFETTTDTSPEATRNWARKILYLHHHPELFQIFKIRELESAEPFQMDFREFYHEKKTGLKRRLGHTVHEDLFRTLQKNMQANGIKIPETIKAHAKYLASISGNTLKEDKAIHFLSDSYPLSLESIRTLKKILPEINLRQWYEHVHQGILAYFLGYLPNGQIDYSLPEGWSGEDLRNKDKMESFILERKKELYPSGAKAAQASGLNFMQYPSHIHKYLMDSKDVQPYTLARLAEALQIPRRLMYWFFKREELEQILEPNDNIVQEDPILTAEPMEAEIVFETSPGFPADPVMAAQGIFMGAMNTSSSFSIVK